jgi:hypothetical protein
MRSRVVKTERCQAPRSTPQAICRDRAPSAKCRYRCSSHFSFDGSRPANGAVKSSRIGETCPLHITPASSTLVASSTRLETEILTLHFPWTEDPSLTSETADFHLLVPPIDVIVRFKVYAHHSHHRLIRIANPKGNPRSARLRLEPSRDHLIA